MVKRVVREECRRSARITALEEGRTNGLAGRSSSQPVASRKRGRKSKSLHSVVTSLTHLPHQATINLNDGGSGSGSHLELEHLSSPQEMPAKQKLEIFLDVLQRRDKYEIFAQPVDGKEVIGYYDFVKEPMDFGTMRAKLHEGMYSSLAQFERDVILISSNAMKFNPSNTVYYREARAMSEMAQRLFRALRSGPENFEVECTRIIRRPGRKTKGEASTSNAQVPKSCCLNDFALKSNTRRFHGHNNNNASTSGARDGGDFNLCELDKRMTYMPRAILSENDKMVSEVLNAPKFLQLVNSEGSHYGASLMKFVKDLGPTAQMVAKRKYLTEAPKSQSWTPPYFGFAPQSSCFQNPGAFMDDGKTTCPAAALDKGKAVCSDEGADPFRRTDFRNRNLVGESAYRNRWYTDASGASSNIQKNPPPRRLLNHPDPSNTPVMTRSRVTNSEGSSFGMSKNFMPNGSCGFQLGGGLMERLGLTTSAPPLVSERHSLLPVSTQWRPLPTTPLPALHAPSYHHQSQSQGNAMNFLGAHSHSNPQTHTNAPIFPNGSSLPDLGLQL